MEQENNNLESLPTDGSTNPSIQANNVTGYQEQPSIEPINLGNAYEHPTNETEQPNNEPTLNTVSEQPAVNQNETNGINVQEPKVDEVPPTNKKKGKSKLLIVIVLLILIIAGVLSYIFLFMNKDNDKTSTNKDINSNVKASEYRMSGNSLEAFDLYFLKLENGKANKVYSPLSIKYALEMLAEGSDGDSKAQLDAVIGDYKSKKYTNSENMSFANALFIRNSFKDSVKEEYINLLLNKYNAEVRLDSFESANTINSWAKEKTLGLLDNLIDDSTVQNLDFALINALAIDMEWEKVIQPVKGGSWEASYPNENYSVWVASLDSIGYHTLEFNGDESAKSVSIGASINNYDIVKDLGKDKIRETVGIAYQEWLEKGEPCYGEYVEKDVNKYLDENIDEYIEKLDTGYKQYSSSTDFKLYVDDDVKVFAKDLKEYNGITLQYVGIMPKNVELDSYINNTSAADISNLIANLKEINSANFKEGVITKIVGYIPLFDFDYELDLLSDLKKLGILDVFDSEKSNLSKITSGAYIDTAVHKANIKFTNEGIKASAATLMGGYGSSGCGFEYRFDVPVEEIDITFDKPYMFIIRDKSTGEVWFTGSVYEPTKWSNEMAQEEQRNMRNEY